MADQPYRTVDKFDRMMGALEGLPDVIKTAPATRQIVSPLIGAAQAFVIQTYRQKEVGDTIFIVYVDDQGSTRLAIPPAAADAIAAQREALTTKNRKRAAKENAAARKARGELPGFMLGKKPKTKKGQGK